MYTTLRHRLRTISKYIPFSQDDRPLEAVDTCQHANIRRMASREPDNKLINTATKHDEEEEDERDDEKQC